MTNPLNPGARPGRSEFSHGRGKFSNPGSDYQSQRDLDWEVGEDKRHQALAYQMELRSDPTNSQEIIAPDMMFAKGNPDMFGPDAPLVQEAVVRAPAVFKQPVLRYGVDRQD